MALTGWCTSENRIVQRWLDHAHEPYTAQWHIFGSLSTETWAMYMEKGHLILLKRQVGIKTHKFRDLLGKQQPEVIVLQICGLQVCVALCLFYTLPGGPTTPPPHPHPTPPLLPPVASRIPQCVSHGQQILEVSSWILTASRCTGRTHRSPQLFLLPTHFIYFHKAWRHHQSSLSLSLPQGLCLWLFL